MARPLKLKPRQIGDRWVLDIPAELSDTGARQRPYFKDIEEARLKASEIRARKHNLRIEVGSFPEILKHDALRAIELVHSIDPKATLFQAAQLFADAHAAKARSVTFAELFDLYLELKNDRSKVYLNELTITKRRLAQFHDRRVCDIQAPELESFLVKLRPGARNAVMRYLRAIFNVGVRRQYLSSNPILQLEFVRRPRKEVEILLPEQFRAMLECALRDDPGLVPFLVVCGFAGVRPDGEAVKIEWSDYDWAEGRLEVRPEITKTNQRRFVELEPCAREWLNVYLERGESVAGLMAKFTSESSLRDHREANRKAAGITHWANSILRHSYASYWATLHDNIDKLLFMLGHSSLEMLRRHYRKAVPKTEAEKYFSIFPPSPAENVVSFSSAKVG
jgi:integrase/recombinase XerD